MIASNRGARHHRPARGPKRWHLPQPDLRFAQTSESLTCIRSARARIDGGALAFQGRYAFSNDDSSRRELAVFFIYPLWALRCRKRSGQYGACGMRWGRLSSQFSRMRCFADAYRCSTKWIKRRALLVSPSRRRLPSLRTRSSLSVDDIYPGTAAGLRLIAQSSLISRVP